MGGGGGGEDSSSNKTSLNIPELRKRTVLYCTPLASSVSRGSLSCVNKPTCLILPSFVIFLLLGLIQLAPKTNKQTKQLKVSPNNLPD